MSQDNKNRTLAIIADNPEITTPFSQILPQEDVHVLTEQELRAATRQEPLPDIFIIHESGVAHTVSELCRQLTSKKLTRDIPVLVIVDSNDRHGKVKAFEAGAADYLSHPFLPEEVVARITTHLTLPRLQEALEEASLTDPLTGMRNRHYLSKFIEHDIQRIHRDYAEAHKSDKMPKNADIVFLMLDIDYFKAVNDTYGHEAGDRVLIQFQDIFEDICRQSDIFVRWGGEEFLIVCRYTNHQYARAIAGRIRRRVESTLFELGNGQTLHKTCSIGLATYPFFPEEPTLLHWEQSVAIAEKALRIAKQSGRNAYVSLTKGEYAITRGFFHRFQEHFPVLVASGELDIQTSLPATETLMLS